MFGGRSSKRVKSDRSWIGSVTTIERAFPNGKHECTPAIRNRAADDYPERLRVAALEYSGTIGRNAGGTAKPGWSRRKGRHLSPFLGGSGDAIRPISRFFFQLRIRSFMPRWCFRWCSCKG
jgi:hypothetical protein